MHTWARGTTASRGTAESAEQELRLRSVTPGECFGKQAEAHLLDPVALSLDIQIKTFLIESQAPRP
eukprot:scaffold134885_cov20-Tisochrysis_lutea.AAC.1